MPEQFAVSEIMMTGLAVILILIYVPLIIGLIKIPYSRPQKNDAKLPDVTVLISARNEQRDLPDCIEALLHLDYPKEKLQIILVNDRSTDNTSDIITQAARKHEHILALHTTDFNITLQGKSRAIAAGFRHASGEWVAMTDADGSPHPLWLRHLLNEVPDQVGMVGGSLIVEPKGLVGIIERGAFAYVQMFNVGIHSLGGYISCIGSNMIIRRYIYEDAGGLENVPDGPQDDLYLHNMVVNAGFKVLHFMDRATSVRLKPVPGISHLMSQQRRWLGGGFKVRGYFIPLLIVFWTGFLVGFFVTFGWLFSLSGWLILVGTKTTLELSNTLVQRIRFREKGMFRTYWGVALYMPIAFMILPASFLFWRNVCWRGNDFVIKYD